MSRFPRMSRAVVAALLAVSAVAVTSGTSAAEPLPTGSLVDNGNGSVTMTYDGPADAWYLILFDDGTPCPVGTEESPGSPTVFASATYGATGALAPWLGLTSVTLSEGTDIGDLSSGLITPLPAGTYQVCLNTLVGGGIAFVSVVGLEAEIGAPEPEPTTTTTAAPTTTTTEAAVAPATPRYTG